MSLVLAVCPVAVVALRAADRVRSAVVDGTDSGRVSKLKNVTRRTFIGTVVAGGALATASPARSRAAAQTGPALLGGAPVRRTPFPSWPVADTREEDALLGVLRSGKWFRGAARRARSKTRTRR